MSKKDGGPAFPIFPETGNAHAAAYPGMTLRQWFAGQALAWAGSNDWVSNIPEHMAKRAYQMADAMIAEGEKS